MADAKGSDDRQAEAKDGGEGKFDEADAKVGGGGSGALLRAVATEAAASLFGGDSELMVFVSEYAYEWDEAVDGERDGSGSPIKKMSQYRSMHAQFVTIVETWLEKTLARERGSIEDFMDQVKTAVRSGDTAFGPKTREWHFVDTMLAMEDFETFHRIMIEQASAAAMSPMPRGHK